MTRKSDICRFKGDAVPKGVRIYFGFVFAH